MKCQYFFEKKLKKLPIFYIEKNVVLWYNNIVDKRKTKGGIKNGTQRK